MSVSEETLRNTYRNMPDGKLLRVAAEDAAQLRPEALATLRAELQARGLWESTEKGIEVQLKGVSAEEVAHYCALVQAQPCPRCRSTARPLNATVTSKVLSVLVLTTTEKKLFIACPTCLEKLNREATTYSALLGWWGIPWGIVHTIRALMFNAKMEKTIHVPHANEVLHAYVLANIGYLAAASSNPAQLQALIKRPQ